MSELVFMKLDGKSFEGEEPIGNSKGLVRIKTFSHAISQDLAPMRPSVNGTTKELRKGSPTQGPFNVTRYFDKVSPKLFSAACAGIRFERVSVFFCSMNPDTKHEKHTPEPILQILLQNAVITDFQYSYLETWPSEVMSFAYTSIGWRTNWPDPEKGTWQPLEDVGWNGEWNKPVAPAFSTKDWEKWD